MLGEEDAAREIMSVESISDYMGHVFEEICRQYMVRLAKNKRLPFVPHVIGKWWGNNPAKKAQDDIDILAFDKNRDSAIFCECKYRNHVFDKKEYEDFMSASAIFTQPVNRYYYIFSKEGYSDWVKNAAQAQGVQLLGIEDLFPEGDKGRP